MPVTEVWDHAQHPSTTVGAGGFNTGIAADSPPDIYYDMVDIMIFGSQQWFYRGTVSWTDRAGSRLVRLLEISSTGAANRIRISTTNGMMDINVNGRFDNHNGANQNTASIGLNLMQLVG